MGNLVNTIEVVEKKITKLIQVKDDLTRENLALQEKIKLQKEELNRFVQKLEKLEADNKSLHMTNALLGSDEFRKETKLKINSLIREIDQCIIQLAE